MIAVQLADGVAMVADQLLRATVLITAAGFALWLLRERSAATREMLGRWVLLALVLLPVIAVSGVRLQILPNVFGDELLRAASATANSVALSDGMPLVSNTATASEAPSSNWIAVLAWIPPIWIGGMCALLLRILLGHALAAHRLFGRNATQLPAELCQQLAVVDPRLAVITPATAQPVAAGLLRPRIALPPAFLHWPPTRQAAVLAHERAHVQRRDGTAVVLRQLARAIWWPHPLVWALTRRLALLSEQACDDRVIEQGVGVVSYAKTLVDVARDLRLPANPGLPVSAMTMTTSQLEQRVRALLQSNSDRSRPRAAARFAAASATLVFALLCGASDATAQKNQPQDPKPTLERAKTQHAPSIDFAIQSGGRVLYAGRNVGLEGVASIVKKLTAEKAHRVILRVEKGAKAKVLVSVIDAAKQNGAKDVAITTEGTPAAPAIVPQELDPDATGDRPPRVMMRVAPALTAKLRARTPAKVVVACIVDERGLVQKPRIVESTDPAFDELCKDAIKRWRFEPFKRQGKAVSSRLRMPFLFAKDGKVTVPYAKEAKKERARKATGKKRRAINAGTFSGTVMDDDFDVPLGGVKVLVIEVGRELVVPKTGAFSLDALPAGKYTIAFSKKGYATQVKSKVVIEAGKVAKVAVRLSAEFEELDPVKVGGGR